MPLEDVVRQDRFLDISACAEQPAGRCERLGDFGDDSGGAENRELRADRGEQVAGMTLSAMIGMDGDLVEEGPGRPLGADQDADRVRARESDHAAAAPDLQVADRLLERGRRHGRLVGKVRRPAAIQRVDEQHRCRRSGRSGTTTSVPSHIPELPGLHVDQASRVSPDLLCTVSELTSLR